MSVRSVSYLPGRWTAVVTDALSLLADVPLADPLLAACWDAGGTGGADAVLEVLGRPGQQRSPSFVLVAAAGEGLRLVVAGRAHAEVFAGQAEPVVHGAGDGGAWSERRLERMFDVRLVADDPTPFERISPLPLTSGIVLASYVFTTATAPPPPPVEAPDDAVGWIPPPLAQPSKEFPAAGSPAAGSSVAGFPAPDGTPGAPPAWDEPAPAVSGVFRALPWRSSLVDPDDADTPGPATDTVIEPPAPVDVPDAAPEPVTAEPDVPPPPPEKPSFGAPGYEPPPFGAEAWDAQAPAPADYVYPPPVDFGYPPPADPGYPPPPPSMPPPPSDLPPPPPPVGAPWPDPPSSEPPPPPPPPPGGPLVQAVHCTNGHPNPLHIDACRVCGAAIPPQQPVTIERPPLGVLHLSTGETVVLDRDALLGRAPFAVDQQSIRLVQVPSPNNDISRSHLRITLDGWQVFATDLGSTNGTAVALPDQPEALLRPHDPFALAPGSVLSLADEAQARFDVG